MKKYLLSPLFLLLLTGVAGKAQGPGERKNELKLNLFSLALKTVSVQYERDLRPHLTAALGVRYSPPSSLPFRDELSVSGGAGSSDDVILEGLTNTRLRNFAITPEVRYYFRRDGEPRGLYGALFGRYASNGITSSFRTESTSSSTGYRDVVVDGSFNAGSIGLMLGAKFRLSNTVMLDWWIAGPMYTSGTLNLDVDLGQDVLTPDDRDKIQRDADRGVSIGPVNITDGKVTFRTDGFNVKVPIQLPEFRTGLALGIRF